MHIYTCIMMYKYINADIYIVLYINMCTNHPSQRHRLIQLTLTTVIVNKWVEKARTTQQFTTDITGICYNRNAFPVFHFGFDLTMRYLGGVDIATHTTTTFGHSSPSAGGWSRLQLLSRYTRVKSRTNLYTCV